MNSKVLIFGFLFSLVMSGCIVYHPLPNDVPLISKKNDLRIDAGVSIIPSMHTTISYGLTDKIAVQGFGSASIGNKYYYQAATGVYKKLANQYIMELYGGFGYGHSKAESEFTFNGQSGYLYGNYQLYYAQINYGKISIEHPHIDFGFSLKTGFLNSNLIDENYHDWVSEFGPFIKYHHESILVEPIAFMRVGKNRVKFSVIVCGTWIYKLTYKNIEIPYKNANIACGMNFRL